MAMKAGRFVKTEQATLNWLLQARTANIPLTSTIIQIKAEEFSRRLGENGFTASNGWLDRFKKRHQIKLKSIKGEANSVNPETVETFRAGIATTLPQRYAPEDIFNCDETGLFWGVTANKTLTFKNDPCKGTKQSKARVTILPCANMTGTEKKQLFVIGRYKNPRAFKNRRHMLRCTYRWNDKSWMRSDLFTQWLIKWNRKLSMQGRRIALVLDNAPCHPNIALSNIELVFLPPNTTSHTQPLDQGIIANFKSHYRHMYTLGYLCPAMEAGKPPAFNLFDAIQVAAQAWSMVTPRTIARCFKRAGFKHPAVTEPTPEEEEEENLPLAQLAARLTCVGIPCDTADADRILTEDDGLQTHAISEEEIDNELLTPVGEDEVPEPEDASESLPIKPSHKEFLAALEAIKLVQLYASFEDGPEMDELHTLSFRMQSIGIRHMPKKKQTT
ncbi:unnamed protein product, partial [Meganyctiphanes norvegica]